MQLSEDALGQIWEKSIKPEVFPSSAPSESPVTVFLGGQPGAGKTQAQIEVSELYAGERLTPLIGDDYRYHHPDFDLLCRRDPLRMPDVTAFAAGRWLGMCVHYANENKISMVIEGTWRNLSTVLDQAREAKDLGRRTHAVVIAVPPVLSRLGIMDRFYRDQSAGRPSRWTPPAAHDAAIAALRENVRSVAESVLVDRFSVLARGGVVYDSLDQPRGDAYTAWRAEFDRTLTTGELKESETRLADLGAAADRFTPDNSEARGVLRLVREDLDKSRTKDKEAFLHMLADKAHDMPGGRRTDIHTRNNPLR